MKQSKYNVVIFDLDGTLLDTSKGIFNSVRYAESKMGFNPVLEEQLALFVGPPPVEMYQKIYGVSLNVAMEATKYHREYGRNKGFYESIIYEGMVELLHELKNNGVLLGVATLKAHDITIKLLDYFELSHFFDAIVGIDNGESLTKTDTIKIALNKCKITDYKKSVLIGDSKYDAIGALEVGCDFIGVTYGYGFTTFADISEFDNVGFVDNVGSLKDLLLD